MSADYLAVTDQCTKRWADRRHSQCGADTYKTTSLKALKRRYYEPLPTLFSILVKCRWFKLKMHEELLVATLTFTGKESENRDPPNKFHGFNRTDNHHSANLCTAMYSLGLFSRCFNQQG
jgi:hypothetical protein